MLKKTLLITLLVIVATSIFIYSKYEEPHTDITETVPDISLDSKLIIDEFISDENKANEKYLDQIIQLEGTIKEISSIRGKTVISLGKGDVFGNVNCHMISEESDKQQNLKIGQTVTIKGICTGYLLNVILVRCVLIN